MPLLTVLVAWNFSGLIIDISRGNGLLSAMQVALTAPNIRVPMAPATGLYLHTAFFERYNMRDASQKWGLLDFDSAEILAPRQEFREKVVWPHIVELVGRAPLEQQPCPRRY